jgi:hypothetical protein
MSRSVIFSIFCTLMIAVAVGYLAITRARSEPAVTVRRSDAKVRQTLASLDGQTGLLFVSTAFDVTNSQLGFAPSGLTDAGRSVGELRCERVHFAADAGICLEAHRGPSPFTSYRARTFGPDLRLRHSIPLAGAPSRLRVSPDGRRAAITVFVSGDSYNATRFSTRATLIDMNTGTVLGDLEGFTVWRAGKRFKAVDFNFWA